MLGGFLLGRDKTGNFCVFRFKRYITDGVYLKSFQPVIKRKRSWFLFTARLMDSEVQRDGRVLDLTDDAWREDRLPYEDVTIPQVTLHSSPSSTHSYEDFRRMCF